MKTILVLAGSNSRQSINLRLASHAGSMVAGAQLRVLDLNDFEMPIFSPEREAATGVPRAAAEFVGAIQSSDGVIVSLAEYNGSYSAAFKNVLDWSTRHTYKLWSGKPMLLLSTSPGKRGGATVMGAANQSFPHLGAQIVASFSLPAFGENFSDGSGIHDFVLASHFKAVVDKFVAAL